MGMATSDGKVKVYDMRNHQTVRPARGAPNIYDARPQEGGRVLSERRVLLQRRAGQPGHGVAGEYRYKGERQREEKIGFIR